MSEILDRVAWFQGSAVRCPIIPAARERVYRVILLGAPGIGKGTQAKLLHERLGTCHLSTGDVFRAAKQLDTCQLSPELKVALDCMRRGELVSDQTVLGLIRERRACLKCAGGFVLDGFPRTLAQAQALDDLLAEEKVPLSGVINYELALPKVIARLSGRRTCAGCKATFHLMTQPPRVEGVCDHCGGKLFQREDDQPQSIRVRMRAYKQSTAPLVDFYRQRGLLISIQADDSPEKISQRAIAALDSRLSAPSSVSNA